MKLSHGEMLQGPYGGLRIWKHPEKTSRPVPYVIGADTSAGLKDGDFSCAQVLAASSGEQVAEYRGKYLPTQFGYICARLATYYNDAMLGFETHPSPHGLNAFEAAWRYGYRNLFVQSKKDLITEEVSVRKGIVRTPHSTLWFLNRARDAIREGCVIRSDRLIEEMKAMRLEEGKPKSSTFDDALMAYCFALHVRDDVWAKGEIEPEKVRPLDLADVYWQREEEREAAEAAGPAAHNISDWTYSHY